MIEGSSELADLGNYKVANVENGFSGRGNIQGLSGRSIREYLGISQS